MTMMIENRRSTYNKVSFSAFLKKWSSLSVKAMGVLLTLSTLAYGAEINQVLSEFFIAKDRAEKDALSEPSLLESRLREGGFELLKDYSNLFLDPKLCDSLQNKKTCRQISSNPNLGRKALETIVDYPFKNKEEQLVVGDFQKKFAKFLGNKIGDEYVKSHKFPDPYSAACKKYVAYLFKAKENGAICIEKELEMIFHGGFCVPLNFKTGMYYQARSPDYCRRTGPIQ